MSIPEPQRRRPGPNGINPEQTTSHTTTYTSTTSSSSSFGLGFGNANPPSSLLQSQPLTIPLASRFPDSGPSYQYGNSWPTTSHSSTISSTARREYDEDWKREQRKMTLFAVFFFAVVISLFVYSWSSGGGAGEGADTGSTVKSSWCFWIPLGPVSVGYGSEGFQWSIMWLF